MKAFDTAVQEIVDYIRRSNLRAPAKIVLGPNRILELGELAESCAIRKKALLITGAKSAHKSGLVERITALLRERHFEVVTFETRGREPTVSLIDVGANVARNEEPGVVISAGGGSALDFGKAIAALAVNLGSVEDYLEGVGKGLQVVNTPLPHIAIPTVSGTGSEMTKNAVIGNPDKGYKKSMRADTMIPTVALIDPLLTIGAPPHIVAASGMDAITQLLESCISLKRRPETTTLALEGLRRARQALSICYEDPRNQPARCNLALVSMIGGVCLANAGLAMAHGVAAALGALHEMPHGLACAILLPHTLRHNHQACAAEMKQALGAFLNEEELSDRTIPNGIAAVEGLNQWLQIPPNIRYLGLTDDDVRRLANASLGTSMSGNPIPMTSESIYAFLKTMA